jgi:CDP-glucose 4,6-dehydratase
VEAVGVMRGFWNGRKVFVTGHTGFKGAWLSLWLAECGAKVSGYALPPVTDPNLFELGGVGDAVAASTIADIRDLEALRTALRAADPEVVIHLAAQPLVRESYADPIGTYSTNVMGTANLLEAVRGQPGIRAVVVITTDKCYENKEWIWGYREIDRLGGHDPYSNSKACAELVTQAFRQSFFHRPGAALIASARAGNVIGGGDWSKDRLVPDVLRGCFSASGEVVIRNPQAVRPWQHVLEPLNGYLILAERLLTGGSDFDEGWNFGPDAADTRLVRDVAGAIIAALGKGRLSVGTDPDAPHEANLLQLDNAKARTKLGWKPKFRFEDTIAYTAEWYAAWHHGKDMKAFTRRQIDSYMAL